MMRKSIDHKYAEISSLEDFQYEREKLVFRNKLAETKLDMTFIRITHFLSVSGMVYSMVKDVVIPKLSELLVDQGKEDDNKSRKKTKAK